MKLLLANPNTTQAVTDRMAEVARAVASPGTEILAVTGQVGVPYIATRAEAAVAARETMELMANHAPGCDAAIVSAFADPGLGGAKEMLDIPVVGLAEAAMLTACMLGRRFSIVTFATALGPWYREAVEYHLLVSRLASIRCLDAPFHDIANVRDELETLLVDFCVRVVREDVADVIILGGGPLAGLAERVKQRVPVPLVDCVAAAVRQAEALVALAPRKASEGTFRRPAAKPITGVSPGLARLFRGE
ncbi:MAG: Asp/Glu/hydantoin racemase [Acetobacteraceae bacterium]|nr:Asp/Glu/hydantoin racemase [Acetobacteraceae bacterium]